MIQRSPHPAAYGDTRWTIPRKQDHDTRDTFTALLTSEAFHLATAWRGEGEAETGPDTYVPTFLGEICQFKNLTFVCTRPDLHFGFRKMTWDDRMNATIASMEEIAPKTCVTLLKCDPALSWPFVTLQWPWPLLSVGPIPMRYLHHIVGSLGVLQSNLGQDKLNATPPGPQTWKYYIWIFLPDLRSDTIPFKTNFQSFLESSPETFSTPHRPSLHNLRITR